MSLLTRLYNMLFLMLLLLLQAREGKATSCPNSTAAGVTKPLYLLTLVPEDYNAQLKTFSKAYAARDEINNHSDLLPGYHFELIVKNIEDCSSTETAIGLVNLVKYTVSPPCHPVVAVAGLLCSSHTLVLSPVAGHDGYDLIQLSAANSPIFQTQSHRFPHLWQFLGSATVYSDTVLAIIDQYNWTSVGVVYDTQSDIYTHIAEYLVQSVTSSTSKTIAVFNIRLFSATVGDLLNTISRSETTYILVTVLDAEHANALQQQVHPDSSSVWIHINTLDDLSKQQLTDGTQNSYKCIEQCFILSMQNGSKNTFGLVLYDQIWAFANALNKSLLILKNRKLSIDNYTFGQPKITAAIEEQLSNLSYQGASGWLQFNQYRSVSRAVEVFWALKNGTLETVGLYDPLNTRNFHVNIKSGDLPGNHRPLYKIYQHYISLPVAIFLYTFTGVVTMFTTVQLILYLHYRHHKVVKATSPHLSSLIFLGSYLICLGVAIAITIQRFGIPCLPFVVAFYTKIIILVTGIGLIFLTLLLKLWRNYRIFSKWMNKDFGRCWGNHHLILVIIPLTIIPNIVVVIYSILSILYVNHYGYCTPTAGAEMYVFLGLMGAYMFCSLVLVLFCGTLNRNIKHELFNDTTQINFLIGVEAFILTITVSLYTVYNLSMEEALAETLLTTGLLMLDMACQLILFLPKLARVVRDRIMTNHHKGIMTMTSIQ